MSNIEPTCMCDLKDLTSGPHPNNCPWMVYNRAKKMSSRPNIRSLLDDLSAWGFRVGDKVRRRQSEMTEDWRNGTNLNYNNVFTIREVCDDGSLTLEEVFLNWRQEYFELVKEK